LKVKEILNQYEAQMESNVNQHPKSETLENNFLGILIEFFTQIVIFISDLLT